jgi:hypothetical protein
MNVSRGLLAGVMMTLAVPVCAQSLGDLAKKEAERRKSLPPASKVYTNDDLKKITVPGDPVEENKDTKDTKDTNDTKDTKDAKDTKDQDAKGAKDSTDAAPAMTEEQWRARMAGAREQLRKSEMFREALQSRINGLTADFTARDDPFQRAQISDQRQKALAELDAVGKDIEKAQKTIADIEDEARRANVPAGWIR